MPLVVLHQEESFIQEQSKGNNTTHTAGGALTCTGLHATPSQKFGSINLKPTAALISVLSPQIHAINQWRLSLGLSDLRAHLSLIRASI